MTRSSIASLATSCDSEGIMEVTVTDIVHMVGYILYIPQWREWDLRLHGTAIYIAIDCTVKPAMNTSSEYLSSVLRRIKTYTNPRSP